MTLFFDIFLLYSRIFLSYYDKLPDAPKNAFLRLDFIHRQITPFYNLVPSVYFKITFFPYLYRLYTPGCSVKSWISHYRYWISQLLSVHYLVINTSYYPGTLEITLYRYRLYCVQLIFRFGQKNIQQNHERLDYIFTYQVNRFIYRYTETMSDKTRNAILCILVYMNT